MLENTKFPIAEKIDDGFNCPIIPPIRKPYIPLGTMQEEFLQTSKRVHETLHRVLELEKNIQENLKNYTNSLSADNSTFKDLCMQVFNEFSDRVTLEVNNFESELRNSYNALMLTWEDILNGVGEGYDTKLVEFKKEVNESILTFTTNITESFENLTATTTEKLTEQDDKITNTVLYIKGNISSYITTTVQGMKDSGELEQAVADAFTELSTNYATLNTRVTAMTNQLNSHTQDYSKHALMYSAMSKNSFESARQNALNSGAPTQITNNASYLESVVLTKTATGDPLILSTGSVFELDRPITLPLITIIGNGAKFKLSDTYTGDRTHIIKFTVSGDENRERIIKDLYFDCTGCNTGIIIEDTRNDKFENITLTNCTGTGIEIRSGFGTYFTNVNVNNSYGYENHSGSGIIIRTSDLHFNNINVMGKTIGIEDRGINFLNNVHIWQGVNNADTGKNAGSIGILKKNEGLYSNIYFDSLATNIEFVSSAPLSIKNCLWLVKYQGQPNFVKNQTDGQALSHLYVDGLTIIDPDKNPDIWFGNAYNCVFENVTPKEYAEKACRVEHSIDNNFKVYNNKDIILRVGNMLYFDVWLQPSGICTAEDVVFVLNNYPLTKSHNIMCTITKPNDEKIHKNIQIANTTTLGRLPDHFEFNSESYISITGCIPVF